MSEITRRTYIILSLSLLLFVSGIFFFFRHGDGRETEEGIPVVQSLPVSVEYESEDKVILKNMPEPDIFPSFIFKKGNMLIATGTCSEFYLAILVYPREVDYRENPSRFVYNNALPCVLGESFSQKIDFDSFPLENGREYYYIRAPQGEKDMWHDPY